MNTGTLLLAGLGLMLACPVDRSFAQAASECTIDVDVGRPLAVEIKRDEVFSVCLPLSAGTGYTWEIQADTDAKAFEAIGTPVFQATSRMPGARGRLRFVLRPTTAGKFKLTFVNLPPGRAARGIATAALILSVQ
jgi:hypothetical protein